MTRLALLLGFAGIALASSASAQGFNIDVSAHYGTPVATFGGGANQPGVWNSVPGGQGTTPLVDLNGAATTATINCFGYSTVDFWFNNALTSGEDQKLMDDASDPGTDPGGATWTISGVAPGDYILYTYAWAPDNASYRSIVGAGPGPDPQQIVGGAWSGSYAQGLTHAEHHVTVAPGGSIVVGINIWTTAATLNGFQLVPEIPGVGFLRCEPGTGGVVGCPCANPPSGPARGCNNSASTLGASIAASGAPVLAGDTLQLATAGELPTATSIVLQGTTLIPAGVVFGQGVRCVGGVLKRLYIAAASGGSISAPPPGFPSISNRSATLGDPIAPGTSRFYLVYYRDPIVLGTCPATSTFNCTTTLEIAWQ